MDRISLFAILTVAVLAIATYFYFSGAPLSMLPAAEEEEEVIEIPFDIIPQMCELREIWRPVTARRVIV